MESIPSESKSLYWLWEKLAGAIVWLLLAFSSKPNDKNHLWRALTVREWWRMTRRRSKWQHQPGLVSLYTRRYTGLREVLVRLDRNYGERLILGLSTVRETSEQRNERRIPAGWTQTVQAVRTARPDARLPATFVPLFPSAPEHPDERRPRTRTFPTPTDRRTTVFKVAATPARRRNVIWTIGNLLTKNHQLSHSCLSLNEISLWWQTSWDTTS